MSAVPPGSVPPGSVPPEAAPPEAAAPREPLLDRVFAPAWAGGWTATRLAFGLVLLFFALFQLPALPDAYASEDMVFANWPFFLADHYRITLRTAYLLWGGVVLGLVGVIAGGRLLRPGLLLFVVCEWILLSAEALNIKAHDRLALWIALGLFLSPAGERGLTSKWRSPAARWYLLVVYAGIYGSTGWLKLLEEPAWWNGDVLAYHLVHRHFAGGPLAAWVSGQRWMVAPMGWVTVLFECVFPLLVWSRRVNPWLLLVGASFHVGIAALMNVGKFSWVALSAYPVLLHPEVARALWERLRARVLAARRARTSSHAESAA